jgi:diguanylate cyclase (GGDEF)-like protein
MEVSEMVVKRLAHKGKAYRYGGEEISLLLPSYSAEEAAGLAERIRKDIAREPLSSKSLEVTASFGVASVPDHGTSASELLENADKALYGAKENGRNRVRIYGELES